MNFSNITSDELSALLRLEKEYTSNKESLEEIIERFNKFPQLFVVAKENNEYIGEISGLIRDDKVIIKSISVKDMYRKQGTGKQLIEYFETQAKAYGNVISVAAGDNVEPFYQKCGYRFKQFLVQVLKENLPEDYKNKGFSIIDERSVGNSIFLYINIDKFIPGLKKKLINLFNAYEVNYILEKKLTS